MKILNEEQSGIFLRDLKLMNLSGMNNSMMADLATAISQSQTLIKLKLSNLNMSLDNISKHLISMV